MAKAVSNESSEINWLRERVAELQETFRVIRHGDVDAVVVSTPEGDRVFVLKGADHLYRVMVETIHEGVATLTRDGVVLYANPRFAEMVKVPLDRLIATKLQDLIETRNCPSVDELLERAARGPQKEECYVKTDDGQVSPMHLSLGPMQTGEFQGVYAIATDITELKQKEKELARLSAHLLRLQDEERRRIAKDLHDSTAQTISALALNLAALRPRIAGTDPRAEEILAESCSLADQAGVEIRNMSHLLHPPALDAVGLVAALDWHVSRFTKTYDVEVKLELDDGLDRFPPDIEIAMFRVAQEALSNAQRHSESSVAALRLFKRAGQLILEVEDEGRGISPGSLRKDTPPPGLGIAGMRERIRQLGGRLDIVSRSRGTLVRAVVPVGG
jgi:PAS domain S-box-containing protein